MDETISIDSGNYGLEGNRDWDGFFNDHYSKSTFKLWTKNLNRLHFLDCVPEGFLFSDEFWSVLQTLDKKVHVPVAVKVIDAELTEYIYWFFLSSRLPSIGDETQSGNHLYRTNETNLRQAIFSQVLLEKLKARKYLRGMKFNFIE